MTKRVAVVAVALLLAQGKGVEGNTFDTGAPTVNVLKEARDQAAEQPGVTQTREVTPPASPAASGDGQSKCLEPTPEKRICVGDFVIDLDYNKGTVREVYADGRAWVDVSGGFDVRRPALELARLVESYRGFREGDLIVNWKGARGKVKAVYENGIVYVKVLDGGIFAAGISVDVNVLNLFRQTQSYDGIQVGDRVIATNGARGTVKEVYENGLIWVDKSGPFDGFHHARQLTRQ